MKLNLIRSGDALFFLLVLLFIFFLTSASGRSLAAKRVAEMTQEEPIRRTGEDYIVRGSAGGVSLDDELLEAEQCHSEDVECLQRRLIFEAHLDYIYTQRHKP